MNKRKDNIYDTDSELNKLFNLEGINSCIKQYHKSFQTFNFIKFLPLMIYDIALFCVLIFASNKNVALAITLIGFGVIYFLHRKEFCLDGVKHTIMNVNRDAYNIVRENQSKFNLDYLVFILDQRIQEKKDANRIFRGAFALFFAIVGLSKVANGLFKQVIELEYKKLSIIGMVDVVVFTIITVWIIFEAYEHLIQDTKNLDHKWRLLFEVVNLIQKETNQLSDKIESKECY